MRKYRNSKVRINGICFDSKLESEHYILLANRLKRGEIKSLARQVEIELTNNAKKRIDRVLYIADFVYFDNDLKEWIVWDSKGMPTDAYKIKRKWLLDLFCGFKFIEAGKKETKEFIPNGKMLLEFKDL